MIDVDDADRETSHETPVKGQTVGKGKPTPKRPRSRHAPPPPENAKEARKRMKERAKEERVAKLEGARRGDEKYLLPRDQGPIRRLVRDIVDSRRNAGTLFFAGTLIVLVGSLQFMPPQVRYVTTMLWIGLIALFIVDSVVVANRIRRTIKTRFPKQAKGMFGHCFYGVMRAVVFRRLRNPAPVVKVGAEV